MGCNEKKLVVLYANHKDADQHVHPRSLIHSLFSFWVLNTEVTLVTLIFSDCNSLLAVTSKIKLWKIHKAEYAPFPASDG